jgi:hypothetical protein
MTEHAELTRLCDEISRLIPSDSLNANTATSQFKEFLTKLKDNHVKPQEINAIIKAYNYFNLLMGVTGDDVAKAEQKKEDMKAVSKETEPTAETKSETKAETKAETKTGSEPSESEESDMIQLLMHLSDESESK